MRVVVSTRCVELIEEQDAAYRESALPAACRKGLVVAASSSFDGDTLSIDRFGAHPRPAADGDVRLHCGQRGSQSQGLIPAALLHSGPRPMAGLFGACDPRHNIETVRLRK